MVKLSKLKTPHLGINTIDVDATLEFYKALDFQVVSEDFSNSSNRNRFVLESDNFIFEVFDRKDHSYDGKSIKNSSGWYHIGLPVSSITKYSDRLKALGFRFDREPQIRPGGHAICFVEDPNGIIVELISSTL